MNGALLLISAYSTAIEYKFRCYLYRKLAVNEQTVLTTD